MIIQGGYDLHCKVYIPGVYTGSDLDDVEYDNHPIASGSSKASTPIKTDVFKTDATLFCRSLPHYIPASLGFCEIDGRDKECIFPCSSKLSWWWKTYIISNNLPREFNCQSSDMKPSALISQTKKIAKRCILHFIVYTYLEDMYMDQDHLRHTLNNNKIVAVNGQAVAPSSTTVLSLESRVAVDG